MSHLTDLTISEALEKLQAKEFSSEELTRAHLEAIAAHNEALNAYIAVTEDKALAQAKEADSAIAAGKAGALAGIPVGVKDLYCVDGVRSTSCSHILDGFVPPYSSTVTDKLFAAGAVMLGKTNMDEFAMGSANINSYEGNCINPWKREGDDTQLVPGGSSGGSASAVAARLCLGSLGSDTGGSIRQPAAFTGIVGVKPTYGRCSRYGMIAFASSLDQAGVFARSVKDAALMQQAICGFDPKDSTSAQEAVPDWAGALNADVKGKKIGIPKEYDVEGMPEDIKALWGQGAKWLQEQGAELVDISLPHTKYALPAYYIIAPAEASSNLARYDGVRYGLRVFDEGDSLDAMYEKTRAAGFGDEVKRRLMIGTYVLSHGYYDAYYKKAQRIRSLIAQDFNQAFEKVDAILTPTTPSAAFGLGEKTEDPVAMYLNDVLTVPGSLAGLPGMSIPAGLNAQGVPLGLQILAKPFDEQTMFDVASAVEQAANFTAKPALGAAKEAA